MRHSLLDGLALAWNSNHTANGFLLTSNQGDEVQEVFDPEMRATRRHNLKWARRYRRSPRRHQAAQSASVIVEVDALLAPCATSLQQHELAPEERMKGVGNPKHMLPIDRITCSWLLL